LRGKRGPLTVPALAAKNTPTSGKIFSIVFLALFLEQVGAQDELQSFQNLFFDAAPVWLHGRRWPLGFPILPARSEPLPGIKFADPNIKV
jgi:hypothetical protein